MQNLPPHTGQSIFVAVSRLFERVGFYGFRSILVLFMVDATMGFEPQRALTIYGIFTGAMVIPRIIGGVVGDFLLDHRKSMWIGGGLQCLGALLLAIFPSFGFYPALVFIGIGSALYTPNSIARFGKTYLDRPQFLEAGFTIFYLAVNIGAFWGTLLVGFIASKFGYGYGFGLAALFFIGGAMFHLISREQLPNPAPGLETLRKNGKGILFFLLALIVYAGFWVLYDMSGPGMDVLRKASTDSLPEAFGQASVFQSLNGLFLFPLGVLLIVFWTLSPQLSPTIKLSLSLGVSFLAFLFIYLFQTSVLQSPLSILLIAIFFLTLGEVLLAPTVQAIVVRRVNPKYLGTLMAVALAPSSILLLIIQQFFPNLAERPEIGIIVAMLGTGVLAIALLVIGLLFKDEPVNGPTTIPEDKFEDPFR